MTQPPADAAPALLARLEKLKQAVHKLEAAENGDERGWVDDDEVERSKAVLIHEAVKLVRYGLREWQNHEG
jgi:hypothetical protein